MCTGEALAPSYNRCAATVVEDVENTLLIQSRDHLLSIVNSAERTVTITKTFHLIQLEPHMVQSKWTLVKTYNPNTNLSVDKWSRDVSFRSALEIAEEEAAMLEVTALSPTGIFEPAEVDLDEIGSCCSLVGYTTAGGYTTGAAEGDFDSDSSSNYDSDCTLREGLLEFAIAATASTRRPHSPSKPMFARRGLATPPLPPAAQRRSNSAPPSTTPPNPTTLRSCDLQRLVELNRPTPLSPKRQNPKRVHRVSPAPMLVGGLVTWLSESEAGATTDGGQHWSMSESDPGWSDHGSCAPSRAGSRCHTDTEEDPTDPDTDAADNSSQRSHSPPVTPSRRRARASTYGGPSSSPACLKRVGNSSNSLSSAGGSEDDQWAVSPDDPEHEWDLDMSQVIGPGNGGSKSGLMLGAEQRVHRRNGSIGSSPVSSKSGRRLSMRSMVKSLLEM